MNRRTFAYRFFKVVRFGNDVCFIVAVHGSQESPFAPRKQR